MSETRPQLNEYGDLRQFLALLPPPTGIAKGRWLAVLEDAAIWGCDWLEHMVDKGWKIELGQSVSKLAQRLAESQARVVELEDGIYKEYPAVYDESEGCYYIVDTQKEAGELLKELRDAIGEGLSKERLEEQIYITTRRMTVAERKALPDS